MGDAWIVDYASAPRGEISSAPPRCTRRGVGCTKSIVPLTCAGASAIVSACGSCVPPTNRRNHMIMKMLLEY
jgi:hypothetical protein